MLSGHVCTFTNAAGKLHVSVLRSELFEDGFVGVTDFNRTNYIASPLFYLPSSSRDADQAGRMLGDTIYSSRRAIPSD